MIGLHQSLLYSNRTIIKRALKNNLKIFQENKKFFAWNSDKTWIYKHTKLNIPRHDNDMDTETWNKNPAHCNFFPFFCSYCVKSDSSKIPRKVWRKNSWLAAANVCNSQAQTSSINSRQYKKSRYVPSGQFSKTWWAMSPAESLGLNRNSFVLPHTSISRRFICKTRKKVTKN